MKKEDRLFGFAVTGSRFIPELDGTLWYMCHEKLGTPLIFFDREDSNKTFYIAFKTLPEDDTGVFHIIEHSVLCGSEKFPVKEPFVELLKGSLKTFLNAMTYPDRTVYPVSSRSDKDLLNLIDVYLDAVFNPLMLKNESIFLQEGYRYEVSNGGGDLSLGGVVYSEMEGAMSSPDEISSDALLKMLYPSSPYGKNSGGDPDAIPTLTYESFCAAHKKYYRPENAYIFLDGSVKLDEVLPLIDSYLSKFEKAVAPFEIGEDCENTLAQRCVEYEIASTDDPRGRAILCVGARSHRFDEVEKAFMLSVIADALCGSNEAPLKKAFLDADLAENLTVFPLIDGVKYCSYGIEMKNVRCDETDKAYKLLFDTLKKLCDEGIGRERLEASLLFREFKLREKDFGSNPKGLIYGLAALDTWLYGGDPALGLCYEDILASAKTKLDGGFYERLLFDTFLKNDRISRLTLLPSNTLGQKRKEQKAHKLKKLKDSLTKVQLRTIKEKSEALKIWQSTTDSEEKLNTLPYLSLSDIPKETEWTPTNVLADYGCEVLIHNIKTDGISYVELLFDISDFDKEELSCISLVASLLGKCRTEKYSKEELARKKKAEIGSLFAAPICYKTKNGPRPYLLLTTSSLDSMRQSLLDLVGEVLNRTNLYDRDTVKKIIKQTLISMREWFSDSGHAAALKRARAYVSSIGAIAECFSGLEMFRWLSEVEKSLTDGFSSLAKKMTELLERAVSRARLTVALTGSPDGDFIRNLTMLPAKQGKTPKIREIPPLGVLNEGIIVPSRVSYAAAVASLDNVGEAFVGSMHVLSNILSYTYLWNTIRVKGGAYGAGFSARATGDVSAYSYRDPSPAESIASLAKIPEFIRTLACDEDGIDSFIIGTIGDYDVLNSARSAGSEATAFYMSGRKKEDEQKIRSSMIKTDKAELLRLADVLEKLSEHLAFCVIGPDESIEKCHNIKTKIKL